MAEKRIIFPEEIKQRIIASDSMYANQYKVLNYIDTNGCTMCHLKLYEWRLLKKEIDSLKLNISFIFIAHLKDYSNLKKLQKINKFPIPIIEDITGIMTKQNNLPTNPLFQTFLLDSTNKILIVGNPINNPKLWNLYKKEIQKASLKNEIY